MDRSQRRRKKTEKLTTNCTKAVIAKGKKRIGNNGILLKPPNSPPAYWVAGSSTIPIRQRKLERYIRSTGSFDVNVWYSHHDHSKTSVYTESIPYKDKIAFHYRDEPTSGHEEIIVNVAQHPNCTEASISECGQNFSISIERELLR